MASNNLAIKKEELEQYKNILEDWIPKDSSIAIAINNSYVYFSPSIHHIHLKLEETIAPNSIAASVLSTRKKTEALIDETIFGNPYYGLGYPIVIDGQQGALIIIFPSTYLPPKKSEYKFLTGKQDEDWMPVPIHEISYIESLQKKTWFYRDDEQFRANMTLKDLERKLPEYFIRIHRSYILNIYYINKITRDLASNFVIELKSGVELPVSQSYSSNLRKSLEF